MSGIYNFEAWGENPANGTKPESRVKRFTRWVDNERVTAAVYFLPYAEFLLAGLGLETLVLAIDGSTVGRECMALMVSVIYERSRPTPCLVGTAGEKGPFSRADAHRPDRAGSALGATGCRGGLGR